MSTPLFRSPTPPKSRQNISDQHFFRRDKSGMAQVRINLSNEEATLIEEAADETPVMVYLHRVLIAGAKYHIKKRNDKRSA